ncbi:MAG TPA: HEPN domain-containing protein [Candidatus Nanoarchaeia archaeon]|nr:HEPN domain-containing protein [Candidatus Nanoarchaeia archaeon]
MKEYDLNLLIKNGQVVDERMQEFAQKDMLKKQNPDEEEIQGHIEKAEHNLEFVKDNLRLGYHDWCITGCYYASYHIVLALIMTRGYTSKNHLATLCTLIKEFYNNGIEREDLEMIDSLFIDYQDLIFYVESKNKREDATYSSKRLYDKSMVESLRIKATLFVDKVKGIIKNA